MNRKASEVAPRFPIFIRLTSGLRVQQRLSGWDLPKRRLTVVLNQLLARANYQNELTKSVTSEYENGENEDAIALVACGFCRVCPRSRVCKSFPFSLFFSPRSESVGGPAPAASGLFNEACECLLSVWMWKWDTGTDCLYRQGA